MPSIEIPDPIITVENDWSWEDDDDDDATTLALKVGGVTIIRKSRVLSTFLLPIAGLIYGIAKIRDGGEKVIAAAIAWQIAYIALVAMFL